MLLKYFYDPKVAHASYMVGCQRTGEAIVIDPARDIEQYMREAEANDLRIVAATETHIHADFVSGARELAERTGAKLYLSDEGDDDWKYLYLADYKHKLLKEGSRFMIGNVQFEVMHTPGHTPESVSFVLTDLGGGANKPMGIFTGDFVFVGAVGRPDLLEKAAGIADTAESGARQMFYSVQRFKHLPDYLQVWPAHGAGSACGKGLGAVPSSTVGYEKLFNPALAYEDEAAFMRYLLAEQPEPPTYFAVMKRVNKEGPAVLHQLPQPVYLSAAQLPDVLNDGLMIIDTRPAAQFAKQHIPGTINIPVYQLSSWAGWFVDYDQPLYLIIDENDVDEAMHDLIYIGIDKVAGLFDTAVIQTLAATDSLSQSYETGTAVALSAKMLNGEVLVVDVRNQTEWDGGHIPGARHLMLGTLWDRADDVVNGQPVVVQCQSGARSAIGASILQAKGAQQVINLQGGIQDWLAAGLPIEKNE